MTHPSRPPLAERLDLVRHPEGGWFRETWRCEAGWTPNGYPGRRSAATAIYFLLQPGEQSRWHVVRSDELWLWHDGGPLALRLGGSGDAPANHPDERVLGPDIAAGQRPQLLVPGGVWQAAAPAADQHVLVTCIVAPGFDMADFRMI
ncbi:MAG TPA: cupin domain-containing protein [Pilimelia sp.]|nr:cupin domain-containing protein [Pilimelia sp.]